MPLLLFVDDQGLTPRSSGYLPDMLTLRRTLIADDKFSISGPGLAGPLRAPQSKIRDGFAESIRRLLIWEKGIPIRGYDPAEWRLDMHGFTIQFSQHGQRDSAFGWEIDHIVPESWGGSDEIQNLQPVYWRVNAHKSDRFVG